MLRPSFFRADVAVALILLHLHVAHAATAATQPNLGKKRCRASPSPTHGHFHDPCNRFAWIGRTPTLSVLVLGPAPSNAFVLRSPAFPLLRSRSVAPSPPRSLAPLLRAHRPSVYPAHSALHLPLTITYRPSLLAPYSLLAFSTAHQRVHIPFAVLFLQDDQDEFLGGWTPMKQVRGGAACLHSVL